MKTNAMVCAAALLCLAAPLRAEEVVNIYRTAKVGDWTEIRTKMVFNGQTTESLTKSTVTKKTADEVTMEVESTTNGQSTGKQPMVINLKDSYDPMHIPGAETKVLATGTETITAGGKSYSTTWSEIEMTMKAGEQTTKATYKIWISKDVPMGGVVKSSSNMSGVVTEMELTGYGNGK